MSRPRDLPTQADLLEVFRYDPAEGKLYREKTNYRIAKGAEVGTWQGTRLVVFFQGTNYAIGRIIWCMVYGDWPVDPIVYKDGDATNNRLKNLREATWSEIRNGHLRKRRKQCLKSR
jgi:hypothetical protein